MRFAADSHPEGYLIRSYGESALTIRDATYRHAILISATQLLPLPELRRAASLSEREAQALLAMEPHIVLVGSPHPDDWPSAQWRTRFLQRGVGVEIMNTGAACRTYNVLMSERRSVAAVLIP